MRNLVPNSFVLLHRFHTLKSTWIKSVTFWMVSANKFFLNHLHQYLDCRIVKYKQM